MANTDIDCAQAAKDTGPGPLNCLSFIPGVDLAALLIETVKEVDEEASRLCYKAIALDSRFALAYALASRCFVSRKANGLMTEIARESADTGRAARCNHRNRNRRR